MALFKRKNKNQELLKTFDGRQVKYVTQRTKKDDSYESVIVGKSGRIAVINNEIRIICGEKDIFKGDVETTNYYLLLSGDGVTVDGINKLTGLPDNLTAYYTYYRK